MLTQSVIFEVFPSPKEHLRVVTQDTVVEVALVVHSAANSIEGACIMGADYKRKEARKRKFGAQPGPTSVEWESAATSREPGQDASEQGHATKKQRMRAKTTERPAEKHVSGHEDVSDAPATAAAQPQDQQNGTVQDQDLEETKRHRYILFIGL